METDNAHLDGLTKLYSTIDGTGKMPHQFFNVAKKLVIISADNHTSSHNKPPTATQLLTTNSEMGNSQKQSNTNAVLNTAFVHLNFPCAKIAKVEKTQAC